MTYSVCANIKKIIYVVPVCPISEYFFLLCSFAVFCGTYMIDYNFYFFCIKYIIAISFNQVVNCNWSCNFMTKNSV